MSSPTSTGFKGLHVYDNSLSETEREVCSASGFLYTRTAAGQKYCVAEASPKMRAFHARKTTWKSASVLLRVPFDNVRAVLGSMGHPPVKAASLNARKPGVPTYIQGFRVTANRSTSDNGATIAIIGRMANGARASAANARRCIYNFFVYGY